ncbi:site-specific tyrosine recombinase XerC [compost metagenome]
MKNILKHTKIEKHATPHIFRHTYISMLTESGVDLPTIMHLVGHANSNTTLATYTHITNKMRESAAEKSKVHFKTLLNPEK